MCTIEEEKNYIWESALRVKILCEQSPDWSKVLPANDLRRFMIEGALLLAKRPVPWVHGIMEASWRHQSTNV